MKARWVQTTGYREANALCLAAVREVAEGMHTMICGAITEELSKIDNKIDKPRLPVI
jgi:hypothetical protein